MKETFANLLIELGNIFDCDLELDANQSCAILYDDRINIQLELNDYETDLIIGSSLFDIPPGRFREEVLKTALKANFIFPRVGTLGYSESFNQLALFELLPLDNLSGTDIADYLMKFVEEIDLWKKAIANGKAGPDRYLLTTTETKSPIDLKHGQK